MSRIPNDVRGDDLQQWVGNTWVECNGSPVRVVEVEYERVFVRRGYDDTEGVDPRDLRLRWPLCGAVNVGQLGALYVQRRAERQWRRSYSARQVRIRYVQEWELVKRCSPLLELGADHVTLVEALFNPAYPPSFDAAVAAIRLDDRPSVALDHRVILAPGAGRHLLVYHAGRKAGKLVPSGGTYDVDVDDAIVRRRLEKMINV